MSFGTTSNSPINVKLESLADREGRKIFEEIMTKKVPKFNENYKSVLPTSSAKPRHKKHEETTLRYIIIKHLETCDKGKIILWVFLKRKHFQFYIPYNFQKWRQRFCRHVYVYLHHALDTMNHLLFKCFFPPPCPCFLKSCPSFQAWLKCQLLEIFPDHPLECRLTSLRILLSFSLCCIWGFVSLPPPPSTSQYIPWGLLYSSSLARVYPRCPKQAPSICYTGLHFAWLVKGFF